MGYGIDAAITLGRIVLAFYGFWLVWRVLLPVLPGPEDREERVAPYAPYFTDPFVRPLMRVVGGRVWLASLLLLVVVAAGQVGLDRLARVV